jgi:hypothetical protein
MVNVSEKLFKTGGRLIDFTFDIEVGVVFKEEENL